MLRSVTVITLLAFAVPAHAEVSQPWQQGDELVDVTAEGSQPLMEIVELPDAKANYCDCCCAGEVEGNGRRLLVSAGDELRWPQPGPDGKIPGYRYDLIERTSCPDPSCKWNRPEAFMWCRECQGHFWVKNHPPPAAPTRGFGGAAGRPPPRLIAMTRARAITIAGAIMTGLFVGSGATFAFLHVRRSAFVASQEPLMSA